MPDTRPRPPCIRHWKELEQVVENTHPATGEPRGFAADLGGATGLTRLGVRHHRLPPGRRSSPPHAERDEEELVLILEGTPDLWQDGWLHRLRPGIAVFWPDRTGQAHCIVNNTGADIRYLTIGEASRYGSRIAFPRDPEIAAWFDRAGKLWTDAPVRRMGPHEGRPGAIPAGARRRGLPLNAVDWTAARVARGTCYPGDSEKMSDFVDLNRTSGLGRIGGGIDLFNPGRRTSWPHAEGDEEEFTFVIAGTPEVWLDGHVWQLVPGDFVGWPSGTGLAHTMLNNSGEPAVLATFGEASRQRSRIWYPFHPGRMKALKARAWTPMPKPRFGPHDGVPEAVRRKASKSSSR